MNNPKVAKPERRKKYVPGQGAWKRVLLGRISDEFSFPADMAFGPLAKIIPEL
jgi:hypothetical protein